MVSPCARFCPGKKAYHLAKAVSGFLPISHGALYMHGRTQGVLGSHPCGVITRKCPII